MLFWRFLSLSSSGHQHRGVGAEDVANDLYGDALQSFVALAEAEQEQLKIFFCQILRKVSNRAHNYKMR